MPTTDPPDSSPPACGTLLIIGASARQYAQSARRAGIVCTTVDLFSDWDLQQFAASYAVSSLDQFEASSFFESFSQLPDRFVICGGMEKRPQLITELSRYLPYVGVSPKQIERLNDPFDIAHCCAVNRIAFPTICLPGNLSDETETGWLLKPFRSAGGARISHWPKKDHTRHQSKRLTPVGTGTDSVSSIDLLTVNENYYLQEFVEGQSYSSLFCSNARTTSLIGSTIQLVGLPPFSNQAFSYCGSIGPVDFDCELHSELQRIGNVLAVEFQMVGIFGIDWVLNSYGKISLIEINPRMTASAEIFEWAGNVPSITGLHLESAARSEHFAFANHHSLVGKAILFSDRTESFTVNEAIFDYFCGFQPLNGRPSVADIPKTGTRIAPGEPILTLFASGRCKTELLSRLESSAKNIRQHLAKYAEQTAAN